MGNTVPTFFINIHEAARTGDLRPIRKWVDLGKGIDARDHVQKTPMHYAAQWGQEEVLDYLIHCGAKVDARDFINDTPLHMACYWGYPGCVAILLAAGANPTSKDQYGNTPIDVFDDHVTEEVISVIRGLVDADAAAKATVNTTNLTSPRANQAPGQPPSNGLETIGALTVVTVPQESDTGINRQRTVTLSMSSGLDGSGMMLGANGGPLMSPTGGSQSNLSSSLALLRDAFRYRIQVADKDMAGRMAATRRSLISKKSTALTPAEADLGPICLHAAAVDGQVAVMRLALLENVPVDGRDANGLTALMVAAKHGRYSSASFLLDAGADVNAVVIGDPPRVGCTQAIHFAAYYCRPSVVRLLLEKGANASAPDAKGRMPGTAFDNISLLYSSVSDRAKVRRMISGDMSCMVDTADAFPTLAPLEAYDEMHKPVFRNNRNEGGAPDENSTNENHGVRYYLRRASVRVTDVVRERLSIGGSVGSDPRSLSQRPTDSTNTWKSRKVNRRQSEPGYKVNPVQDEDTGCENDMPSGSTKNGYLTEADNAMSFSASTPTAQQQENQHGG